MSSSQTSSRSSVQSRASITSAITVSVLITRSVSYLPSPNPSFTSNASSTSESGDTVRPWPYTRALEEETVIYPTKPRRSRTASGSSSAGASTRTSKTGRSGKGGGGGEKKGVYVGFPTTSVEYYPSGGSYHQTAAAYDTISSPVSPVGNGGVSRSNSLHHSRAGPISPAASAHGGSSYGSHKPQLNNFISSGGGAGSSASMKGKQNSSNLGTTNANGENWNWPAGSISQNTNRSISGNVVPDILLDGGPMIQGGKLKTAGGGSGGFWKRFR